MVKMTPEQEAEYALGFGVARSDLLRAAQEAYDRLVEQRTSGGTLGRRLRIWADRPVADPSEDHFGFVQYADALALLVNDRDTSTPDTSTPLTVAIKGPWGAGKTSLAGLLEFRLQVEQYWRLDWSRSPTLGSVRSTVSCRVPGGLSAEASYTVTSPDGRPDWAAGVAPGE